MKQNQFKFKPFDKVLVRNCKQHAWRANIYSHGEQVRSLDNNLTTVYVCVDNIYNYCIPYNEETAHLIGTDKPYKEPEKKEWYVHDDLGGFEGIFTSEELIKFITQQTNNKDLHRFTIVYTNELQS